MATITPPVTTKMAESGFNISPDLDIFNEWIIKNYGGNTRTKTITHEKFVRIRTLIRGDTANTNAKFRFWVRNKGFRLITYDDDTDIIKDDPDGDLYVSLHAREETTAGSNIESFLRTNLPKISFFRKVAVVEDFFEIIKKAHIDEKGQHAGQKKTYRLVSDTYAFLPREVITFYLLNCDACKPRIQKYGPIQSRKNKEAKANSVNKIQHDLQQEKDAAAMETIHDVRKSPSYYPQHTSRGTSPNMDEHMSLLHSGFYKNSSYQNHIKEIKNLPYEINSTFGKPNLKNNQHTENEALHSPPPSLCFIPKGDRIAEGQLLNGRSSNDNITYKRKSVVESTVDFYNYDQLKDIENYIKERKRLLEDNCEDKIHSKKYSYPNSKQLMLRDENFIRKRNHEYMEKIHAEGPFAKHPKIDYNFNAPYASRYDSSKIKDQRDYTRVRRLGLSPLELYSPKYPFPSPSYNGFSGYRGRLPAGQGSVSSGSSDTTDEHVREDDEVIHHSFSYTQHPPMHSTKRINSYMNSPRYQVIPSPPNARFRDSIDQIQVRDEHSLANLIHTYRDARY